jgi:hypothetical protein
VANKQDDTGAVKIIEALEILKKSLLGLGLNRVNISINSHGHTREESADTARAIVATGFGRDVIPAGEPVGASRPAVGSPGTRCGGAAT